MSEPTKQRITVDDGGCGCFTFLLLAWFVWWFHGWAYDVLRLLRHLGEHAK